VDIKTLSWTYDQYEETITCLALRKEHPGVRRTIKKEIFPYIADNQSFPWQKLVGTTATGFALLDSGKIEYISQCITPESAPNAQFNDGGCDPSGRFLAGTRRIDSAIRTCGNLFVYDPHTKETQNITTSAGEFGVGLFFLSFGQSTCVKRLLGW
jgi:hypothetical protein